MRLFGQTDELAHGAAAVLAAGAHHAVDQVDHPGGADQRVRARLGGVVPGVAVLAGRDRVVPDLRLPAGHDADLLGLALEDRTLLDMQLEIGVGREGAGRFRAAIADRVQASPTVSPVDVGQRLALAWS